jgi:hypothetical protein
MAERVSPSPIIGVFVQAANEMFPDDQRARLEGFEDAISRTTDRADARRARHCAVWSIRLADDRDLPHPRWREIKEAHQMWKDVWLGVEFGLMERKDHEPLEDVRIEWTEDAVRVSALIGESEGWAHAPWGDLLTELIEMEDHEGPAAR